MSKASETRRIRAYARKWKEGRMTTAEIDALIAKARSDGIDVSAALDRNGILASQYIRRARRDLKGSPHMRRYYNSTIPGQVNVLRNFRDAKAIMANEART